MLWELKVEKEPFDAIKNGSKTIEVRLNTGIYSRIKKGDEIEFLCSTEKVNAKVLKTEKFSSSSDLCDNCSLKNFSAGRLRTRDDLLKRLKGLYKNEKSGIIAIYISLLKM